MTDLPPSTKPCRASPPEGSVGIVLPIRDDLRFFKLAYHSILAFSDHRFMLTIVDNMSGIHTRQYLESIRKNHNINVLQYQKDHCLSAEWNLGLQFMFAFATVKYGVCLTPTVIAEPYWLSSLVRAIRSPDQFYAPQTNAGMVHALGFQRALYERLDGFDEAYDPVLDAAERVGISVVQEVYLHKFKTNNFDPRRDAYSVAQERQEATR